MALTRATDKIIASAAVSLHQNNDATAYMDISAEL
tara:strand:- start:1902 stop:2006 length:105 start_codon:yes stop_codon:yes gene_type:complete